MKRMSEVIKNIKHKLKQDYDCLMVITGKEGVGKSHLMLNILDLYNPYAIIDDISLNKKDFRINIQKQKRYGNPVFDEAGDGLFSREAMSNFNKEIVKLYMAIRGRNLFTILVLPDFFDLDSFFRKHRVRFLIEVYKRGKFKIWNRSGIDRINQYCSYHRQIRIKPLMYDHFPIYKGHLAEQYKQKKEEKIEEAMNGLNKTSKIEDFTKTEQIKFLINVGFEPKTIVTNTKFSSTMVYQANKDLKKL